MINIKILYKQELQEYLQLPYLQEKDPFAATENLINLATNEVEDESVDMHQTFEIREKLI